MAEKAAVQVGQQTKSIDEILNIAGEMWKKVGEYAKKDQSFVDLPDKKKLEHFRDKLGYKDFMTEYPITSRYMIVMGQYSRKAFKRLLDKISKTKHPPPAERAKGYMEDQWIRRQADYIRYLWEAYQKNHWNVSDAKEIWEDAYKKLKGEFDDFRDKYKEIELNRKTEQTQLKASNAKDLLNRLKDGTQTLTDKDGADLVYSLKNILYKRRFSNVMSQLLDKRKPLAATSEGFGQGPEAEDEEERRRRTVTMVETVDAEAIDKIPAHMRLTAEEAARLPGFGQN